MKIPVLQVLRGLLYFLGLPAVLLLAGGDARWWQAWAYVADLLLVTLVSRFLVAKIHPDLIAERAGYDSRAGTKAWDRILGPLVAAWIPLGYFIIAGLDHRFSWSPPLPVWVFLPGLFLTLLGSGIAAWALVENRFFSGVVRIQQDRGHTVVDTGPYRFLRHPGYAGAALAAISFPLFVNSLWAYLPVAVYLAVLVLRTSKEDRVLLSELPGYTSYARRTPFRLVPGIW